MTLPCEIKKKKGTVVGNVVFIKRSEKFIEFNFNICYDNVIFLKENINRF